nr:TonB-dependent receptor [uncultured Neisseria sp.]
MRNNRLKTIAACLSVLGLCPSLLAADNADASAEGAATQTVTLNPITVKGRHKDERGKDRVYTREIVNLYKGKEEVETFKGNTVSDLFSGLPGVYSGEARNSGALDPNIRGVQGQGRIPVTIDGTEQAITVWRGMFGANNRNYVDPNIISSVYVEKGPSFNREVKSGIGGSVALKTLEADDIVPEGQKYGVEIKAETSNNSIKPRKATYAENMDYRTLENPLNVMGGYWRFYADDSDRLTPRFGGKHKFSEDKAYRIAAATKQENFDAILTYAYRNKGNYFSGKKGAHRYGYYSADNAENLRRLNERGIKELSPEAPIIGLFYTPGGEVANTSLETESWLGKTTFRLPNNQSIKLGLRHTHSTFGEVMPSRILSGGGLQGENVNSRNKIAEWPQAWVKQRAYNIDYSWKPEGSRWIDFNASLWTTRTRSKTNSSGGVPGDIAWTDVGWNAAADDWIQGLRKRPGLDEGLPNTDGRFNTRQAQALYATNNRNGFNFSNRMKLRDNLELTVLGDFQNEKLATHNEFADLYGNRYKKEFDQNLIYPSSFLDTITYPRNGRRREYNLGFNFRFEPRPWLTLTAGARYTNFSLQDDSVKKFLDNGSELEAHRGLRYRAEVVATKKDYEAYQKANACIMSPTCEPTQDIQDAYAKIKPEGSNGIGIPVYVTQARFDWAKDQYGKLNMADHPVLNNPKVLTRVENPAYNPADPSSPHFVNKFQNFTAEGSGELTGDVTYRTPLTPAQKQQALKQKGSGWAPAASVTFNLTDYARAYLRYTQTLRFPSIFEGTVGVPISPQLNTTSVNRYGYQWKPERGKNFEVGYIHDLTGMFPKMRKADFRINYFRNTTKNIIDRNDQLEFEQFDKQIRSGAELSARFDTGKVYGSLGLIRTIRNDVCDEGAAFTDRLQSTVLRLHVQSSGSKPLLRAPTCFPGGVKIDGYLSSMMQPRWSVDAELGARFLKNKLDVGTRFHWHSDVYKTRVDSWRGFERAVNDHYATAVDEVKDYTDGIEDMRWTATAVVDAYLRYRINKNITAELVGTNLTNRYYMDPFSRSFMPAPGRTVRIGITGKF